MTSATQEEINTICERLLIEQISPSMSLMVNKATGTVTMQSTTDCAVYGQTFMNQDGTSYTIIRNAVTGSVIGIEVPLVRDNLVVIHQGPIRINTHFRKDEVV